MFLHVWPIICHTGSRVQELTISVLTTRKTCKAFSGFWFYMNGSFLSAVLLHRDFWQSTRSGSKWIQFLQHLWALWWRFVSEDHANVDQICTHWVRTINNEYWITTVFYPQQTVSMTNVLTLSQLILMVRGYLSCTCQNLRQWLYYCCYLSPNTSLRVLTTLTILTALTALAALTVLTALTSLLWGLPITESVNKSTSAIILHTSALL